jgi:hypothetical protein
MIQGTRGGQRCFYFDCPCSLSIKRTSQSNHLPRTPFLFCHFGTPAPKWSHRAGGERFSSTAPSRSIFTYVRRSSRTSSTTSPFRLCIFFEKRRIKVRAVFAHFFKQSLAFSHLFILLRPVHHDREWIHYAVNWLRFGYSYENHRCMVWIIVCYFR